MATELRGSALAAMREARLQRRAALVEQSRPQPGASAPGQRQPLAARRAVSHINPFGWSRPPRASH